MLRIVVVLSAFLFAFHVLENRALATITLRIDDINVNVGTPSAEIIVLLRSDSSDAPLGLTADIDAPAQVDATGEFGSAGFFGEGNLNASSRFERDGSDLSLALLSLDFDTAQAVPMAETPLARINVNTSALAPGAYALTATNVVAFDSNAASIPIVVSNGTLTVSAVPEPATIALLTMIVGVTVVSRRRRKHSVIR